MFPVVDWYRDGPKEEAYGQIPRRAIDRRRDRPPIHDATVVDAELNKPEEIS